MVNIIITQGPALSLWQVFPSQNCLWTTHHPHQDQIRWSWQFPLHPHKWSRRHRLGLLVLQSQRPLQELLDQRSRRQGLSLFASAHFASAQNHRKHVIFYLLSKKVSKSGIKTACRDCESKSTPSEIKI